MLKIDGAQFTNSEIQSDFRDFLYKLANDNNKIEQIKKVKCFVVLFYDHTQPHIKKVLNDKDFWLALDILTKERLAVIAYAENEYKEPPPMMSMMVNGRSGQATLEETSILLEKVLNRKVAREALPCLLVCSWNKEACEASFGRINISTVDEAYDVLKRLVGELGDELMTYEEKDLSHPEEVVSIATDYLNKKIGGIYLKQSIKGGAWLLTLARFLTGLVP